MAVKEVPWQLSYVPDEYKTEKRKLRQLRKTHIC